MAAQIPTSFGHELRACLRCRLVKTYDQVSWGSLSLAVFISLAIYFVVNMVSTTV